LANENAHKPLTKLRVGLPSGLARGIPSRPWIHVEKSEEPWVEVDGGRIPVEVHPLAASMSDRQLAEFLQRMDTSPGRRVDLIVSPRLRASARMVLEAHGRAYADSQGHLHLPMPGFLVHLEAAPTRAKRQRTAPGIGPSGVRAIQALLETDEPSQISGLAAQVKLSLAQTHAVLEALEEAGLVRSTASGPARRRTVPDRAALLDWLVTQPSARRREPRVDVYVYARRPEELWRHISQKLDAAGIAHALTGAAGAALYGVGPTAVPLTLIRTTPDVSLEDVVGALVAEPTERGANVRILRDTGLVGSMGAARRDEVKVAPKVRIYLDALSEKRGEDLAQQFREVCLGY
jgi:hypothetical protein